MAEVKEKLVQCKQLLHCRQDELRSLWVEGIEYKKTMQLLEFVNSIRDTPNVVEKLVAENNFLEAAQKVQKALQWCQEDLGEVGALQDLRHEIQAKVRFSNWCLFSDWSVIIKIVNSKTFLSTNRFIRDLFKNYKN